MPSKGQESRNGTSRSSRHREQCPRDPTPRNMGPSVEGWHWLTQKHQTENLIILPSPKALPHPLKELRKFKLILPSDEDMAEHRRSH